MLPAPLPSTSARGSAKLAPWCLYRRYTSRISYIVSLGGLHYGTAVGVTQAPDQGPDQGLDQDPDQDPDATADEGPNVHEGQDVSNPRGRNGVAILWDLDNVMPFAMPVDEIVTDLRQIAARLGTLTEFLAVGNKSTFQDKPA
ncbi:hypothetical protein GGR51DRAFT_563704 [Nemania sp. FL0031]|nr:hypothetical protein GGR51DRAFT_563704 [Nemania sp. FL0031]